MSRSRSPPPKRVKRESPPTPTVNFSVKSEAPDEPQLEPQELEEEEDEDRCSICLQEVVDRTVVPGCAHEFCFDCLLVWAGQSRRCPLCSQGIGAFLIHKIRSRYDYQKHYLNPLPTSPVPLPLLPRRQTAPLDAANATLERSVAKRRWIYEHDLYAKHVASNAYTRYRPYPTPAQFTASPELISRTTMFLRRELQVWVNLDVEFLTTFIISIMKAIDIRSESAVKLLSEFLDLDAPYIEGGRHVNAEHFAHEVYSYVRSPYKDLFVYDSVVQYEVTAEVPALVEEPRRRWREASRSRSPAGSARDARAERKTARIQYNEPECPPQTPGAATEITETLNSKGKALSILGVIPSKEETSKLQEGCVTEATVPPFSEASRKPPRIRNRSLFESVQAHLAAPSRKHRETTAIVDPPPNSSNLSDAFDEEKNSSVPSLLTRLSEPGTQQTIRRKPDGDQLSPVEAVAGVPIESELLPTKPSFSAPEIMARTRARLAKLAAIDPSSESSLSLDGGVGTARPPSSALLSIGSGQDGNSDISAFAGNIGGSPRRAKLLGRLEEEKRKAGGVAPSHSFVPTAEPTQVALNVAFDRISQVEHPIAFPNDVTSIASEEVDAAEARLRRQAQLRVRLAAEKRKHASGA
ncbi:hypothetical protein B0H13DRAFT_2495295 [Mycena leptocephala]|nr:hypothetical protein B0H13DRAFT_2495295 [Mycena leptocephala]